MKNLKFLVIALALVIGISSCKKEENASSNNASIVGKWFFTKDAVKSYRNGVITKDTVYTPSSSNNIEFKVDGRGDLWDSDTVSFTYTLQNEGKKLTINYPENDKMEYDIKLLNNNELVLYDERVETQNSVSYKYTHESTYIRK